MYWGRILPIADKKNLEQLHSENTNNSHHLWYSAVSVNLDSEDKERILVHKRRNLVKNFPLQIHPRA